MTGFVLDCSVCMAWCFEDEASGYADSVLGRLGEEKAVAPGIWPLEVANVLLVGERRQRLTGAATLRFVELLSALPIGIDESTTSRAQHGVLSLAREQNLSAYDASYLELAVRRAIPLATLDKRLREACNSFGVRVLDE